MKATYGIKRANNQTLCLTLRHGNVNFTLEIIDIIYFSQYLCVQYSSHITQCYRYILSRLLRAFKSGGTKDNFRWVKVRSTAPY